MVFLIVVSVSVDDEGRSLLTLRRNFQIRIGKESVKKTAKTPAPRIVIGTKNVTRAITLSVNATNDVHVMKK
jgi:hypothetical protein